MGHHVARYFLVYSKQASCKHQKVFRFFHENNQLFSTIAGGGRIELPPEVLETPVLPLN